MESFSLTRSICFNGGFLRARACSLISSIIAFRALNGSVYIRARAQGRGKSPFTSLRRRKIYFSNGGKGVGLPEIVATRPPRPFAKNPCRFTLSPSSLSSSSSSSSSSERPESTETLPCVPRGIASQSVSQSIGKRAAQPLCRAPEEIHRENRVLSAPSRSYSYLPIYL